MNKEEMLLKDLSLEQVISLLSIEGKTDREKETIVKQMIVQIAGG